MPEHSGTSMGGSIPTRWPPGRAWKDGLAAGVVLGI